MQIIEKAWLGLALGLTCAFVTNNVPTNLQTLIALTFSLFFELALEDKRIMNQQLQYVFLLVVAIYASVGFSFFIGTGASNRASTLVSCPFISHTISRTFH